METLKVADFLGPLSLHPAAFLPVERPPGNQLAFPSVSPLAKVVVAFSDWGLVTITVLFVIDVLIFWSRGT